MRECSYRSARRSSLDPLARDVLARHPGALLLGEWGEGADNGEILLKHIDLRQSRNTSLIEIRAYSDDKEEAALLANRIVGWFELRVGHRAYVQVDKPLYRPGETIWQVAHRQGIDIQALSINGFWWYDVKDRDLAGRLKKRCGVGGSVSGTSITNRPYSRRPSALRAEKRTAWSSRPRACRQRG